MDYYRYDPGKDIAAAQYVPGESLDSILAVARIVNPGAKAAEVPAWKCLLVKIPGRNEASSTDLVTMHEGDWLYVSKATPSYVMKEIDGEFQKCYRPVAA